VKSSKEYAIEREVLYDSDSIQDDADEQLYITQRHAQRSIYLFQKIKYRKCTKKFDLEDCLCLNSETYNEEEFLFNFRLTRELFFVLLEEMESKKAFANCEKNKDLLLFSC
jgi:hypothetical protein